MAKKKLQNLVGWGDIYVQLEINKCPNCQHGVNNLKPMGFYLSVCKRCNKFWSLKVVDVTKELDKKFVKENLKDDKRSA